MGMILLRGPRIHQDLFDRAGGSIAIAYHRFLINNKKPTAQKKIVRTVT